MQASPRAPTQVAHLLTPLGALLIEGDPHAVRRVRFVDDEGPSSPPASGAVAEAAWQLAAYFRGERRTFDVPLAPTGTAFQRAVWTELSHIPWGTTTSYGALARSLGKPPGAARAVGAANGRNPLPILVPCHRVIGASGDLVGYAFGLDRKRWLLAHEAGSPS